MKLLRRAKPYAKESLAGYIVRLTYLNHYSSPDIIFKMAEISDRLCYLNVFFTNKDKLSKLSYITEVPESTLWSMAFSATSYEHSHTHEVNGFGESFSAKLLNNNYFTICTACLAEKPYYLKVWDLYHVTVCPFHKLRLINSCPSCGKVINLSSPDFFQCKKCKFDFQNFVEKPIFEEWLLSAYIYSQVSFPGIESVFSRCDKTNPYLIPPFFAIPVLSLNALTELSYEDIYFLQKS